MKYLLLLVYFFCISAIHTQDYGWWEDIHQYDGITPWEYYMIYSPEHMGPNALPVPQVNRGIIENAPWLEAGLAFHAGRDDQTKNLWLSTLFPIGKQVNFSMNYIPVEHYQMSADIRDYNVSRDYDGEGFAHGDVYIATHIQLIKEKQNLPDLMLSVGIKTASGDMLKAARYTDTPGYYFDLSFGKEISLLRSSKYTFRIYGMGGFYAWQIYHRKYRQNDAFLFGGGFDFSTQRVLVRSQIGGYAGYIDNGDKAVVIRLSLEGTKDKTISYKIFFQHGLNDFPFTTAQVSGLLNLDKVFYHN